jgi:hypothetical protein
MSHLYQISLSCVIGHQMCHRRLPTTDFQSCREGGRGGGGVKKCFLSLRQTALLSAEGKNLTSLANNTRHNIPLEIALQAVGANGAVPVDLNSLLDRHHYVTVPVMTTVIKIILVCSVIGGVVITRVKGDQRENRHNYTYLRQELEIMKEAERNRESRQEEDESRPRKPTAPQPPSYRQPVPPPYAAPGSGKPGYRTSSPTGRPVYSLGASPSLVMDLQANKESTAEHSSGMHREQAAAMLGGFQKGRDQIPIHNFSRAAPTAIDMTTMMARQSSSI